MTDVFLSYSRRNEEIMQRVRRDLQTDGITVWIDQIGLERGSPRWQEDIQAAIEKTKTVVVVLSPAAKQSKWVGMEVGYANAFEKTIYPILAKGNQRTAVPISLINTDWFDIRQRYSLGIAELVKVLKRHLGRGDGKQIPVTSSPDIRRQKIEEIIEVLGGRTSSGTITVGRIRLTFGLQAYQKNRQISYRATISPIEVSDVLEVSKRLELRGWKIGPVFPQNNIQRGNISPMARYKAYVYEWSRGIRDHREMQESVVAEIIAVNELLGIWSEDIKIEKVKK